MSEDELDESLDSMEGDRSMDEATPSTVADLPYELQGFVAPLDDSPCGEDLEYDPGFLGLAQAIQGKPETQFAPAEPPVWREVQSLAEELMGRTRDLRVAIWWTRACVNQEGLPGLALGLTLVHALLDSYWDSLHPGLDPDDGDAFARVNALGELTSFSCLLGDVRQSKVLSDRSLSGLRTRDIEIGLDRISPKADESVPTMNEIKGMLADLQEPASALRLACATSLEKLDAIQSLVNDKVGSDSGLALDDMVDMVKAVASVLPDESGSGDTDDYGGASDETSGDPVDDDDADVDGAPPSRSRSRSGGVGTINSRQDAIKAIQLICAYLESSEPTNPAQLLLRRAERLIEKNFLELLRELAPNALSEVAAIMGVDPNSIGEES